MDLSKIIQGFKDVADNQTLLHEEAMMATQKINLNGLKRLHRHHSNLFYKHGLCIDNFAGDYGMAVKKSVLKGGYTTTDIKDHFNSFIPKLESDIEKLKKLNFEFIQACGMEYETGVCMQECLSKQFAKMKFRWVPRFNYTKWDPMDIMQWDKWLHDKVRCIEEGHHEHHNG